MSVDPLLTHPSDRYLDNPAAHPIARRRSFWRRRWWVPAAVGLLVAGAVTAVVVAEDDLVTDGSVVFADHLADVEARILAENEAVVAADPNHLTIAYAAPMRGGDDMFSEENIRHQVQGAYLAQFWANHPDGGDRFGQDRPLVKLLLADTGVAGADWERTAAELADAVTDDHLVAVAGLGASIDTTQSLVDALDALGVPMVSSVITSSRITGDRLRRVAPSNADEAAAAVAYLTSTPRWKQATPDRPYTAYLVQDRNPTDSYAIDLGTSYRSSFPTNGVQRLAQTQVEFTGNNAATGTVLERLVSQVCSLDPPADAILFAGRSQALTVMMGKLNQRSCVDRPITVVTGDDVNVLAPKKPGESPLWGDTNLDLVYTGLATTSSWLRATGAVPRATLDRFAGCDHCFAALFKDSLDDGQALMAHDALMVTATAAHNAYDTDRTSSVLTPADVDNGFHTITSNARVPGASGWIYYEPGPGSQDGVPTDKAIPIMRMNPDQTSEQIDLSSRTGTPAGPTP
ncbi:ABC transporter substrate-binding protein [Actinokineospora sp. PR83]|uniref:ABC transporter substrate-binding protein n=1 Tax=Actinokineospora sp. PR83 TaxID=2884908 RepID=UPI001F2129F5|nr:ABC transporter substrate-binding protein [Actinokineospora sp. PR83]MCG8919933.1 ABC transporter substrate-binding protein [Actinokineospora sp. PR83]